MTEPSHQLKVFLCHSRSDRDLVKALYDSLRSNGIDAWLDKEKLLAGQDRELEIRKAVRESDVVVACLSRQFNQAGLQQREVRLALETAMEKPEGEIFIIPARLEECDTPESLKKWHPVDLFEEYGYSTLLRALKVRADSIGAEMQVRKRSAARTFPPTARTEKHIDEANPPAPPPDQPVGNQAVSGASSEMAATRAKATTSRIRRLGPEYIVALIGAGAVLIGACITIMPSLLEKYIVPAFWPSATPTIQAQGNKALELSVKANPYSYSRAGEKITYTFTITNIGGDTLGPTQFVVQDNNLTSPTNCGSRTTELDLNDSVICDVPYEISPADIGKPYIEKKVIAYGAGATSSETNFIAIKIDLAQVATPVTVFTRGSTIRHNALPGEWLVQIARCYGADSNAAKEANPAINDPLTSLSGGVVTVPNIGSNGPIYGSPCLVYYPVVDPDDTWESIASKFNADTNVLRSGNPGISLSPGIVIKVPVNSAGH
jgi:hypothetical protein